MSVGVATVLTYSCYQYLSLRQISSVSSLGKQSTMQFAHRDVLHGAQARNIQRPTESDAPVRGFNNAEGKYLRNQRRSTTSLNY